MSWRKFFGVSTDSTALAILCRLYIEESRHATVFAEHADRMRYPQFRAKLLEIAARENKHVEWIGEKIRLLGGDLPAVPESRPVGANSWELLLADLKDESRCAGELLEHAARLETDFPAVAEMLRRIYEDEQKQREQIREMLMRSDPLSRAA